MNNISYARTLKMPAVFVTLGAVSYQEDSGGVVETVNVIHIKIVPASNDNLQ